MSDDSRALQVLHDTAMRLLAVEGGPPDAIACGLALGCWWGLGRLPGFEPRCVRLVLKTRHCGVEQTESHDLRAAITKSELRDLILRWLERLDTQTDLYDRHSATNPVSN